ncbi:MAG: hypothetical protein HGB27_09720 [Chlorobiaceae bacterium]|nr:hypothetical protein [Chlorobiaceae bacterium]
MSDRKAEAENGLPGMTRGPLNALDGVASMIKNSWAGLFIPLLMSVILLLPGGAETIVEMMNPHQHGQE